MSNFLQELKKKILVYDGSKGTMLQNMGLTSEECPELWNLEKPEKIKELYSSYINAGSNVIQTNTFGGNRAILEKFNLQDKVDIINSTSIKLARDAAANKAFVAASIGPTGKLMEPSGDLTFEDAYNIFKEQVTAVTQAGADILNFETISDLNEMRAAILAARENSPLPIIASMTFEPNGYTLMGNSPASCALICQSLGADLLGANCSTGPEGLLKIIKEMHMFSTLPLCVKANAVLPVCSGDNTTYNETPETFSRSVKDFIKNGVKLIGGCCGTTPEYITSIITQLNQLKPESFNNLTKSSVGSFISSGSKYIDVGSNKKLNIGFFITNSNIDNFKNNINDTNLDIVIDRVMELAGENYDIIYLNLDTIDKPELLSSAIKTIQTYSKTPIVIQTKASQHLESALRIYNGKAGVIVGDMDDYTFDLIISSKKYGSTIIDRSLVF